MLTFPFIRLAALTSVALIIAPLLRADDAPIYKNPQAPLEARVEALFQAMTPQERLALLGGADEASTHGIPRLGVPQMVMVDATQGAQGSNGGTSG